MDEEDFAKIYSTLKLAVLGVEFDFRGIVTASGYGTPKPSIQVTCADDLVFGEAATYDILVAASKELKVPTSIAFNVNEIELPASVIGFDGVEVFWSSSSDLINVASGVVKHPTESTVVTLIASLLKDNETYELEFKVTVNAADNNTYQVIAELNLEDALPPTAQSYGNSPSKNGYAEGVVELGTPKYKWLLRNALIAASSGDKYMDTLSIRAKSGKTAEQTARIEIQNDDEYNVVEFLAATYGSDKDGAQIRVEYSTDKGKTWVASETVVTVESGEFTSYRFKLPEGVKRVAIVVVENTFNRVNIDDIKLMK